MSAYNASCAAGKDSAFARTESLLTLAEGPFYVVKTVPYVMLTKGGPKMNANAQVLNAQNKPIPGLYQCGELIGGANIRRWTREHDLHRLGKDRGRKCCAIRARKVERREREEGPAASARSPSSCACPRFGIKSIRKETDSWPSSARYEETSVPKIRASATPATI